MPFFMEKSFADLSSIEAMAKLMAASLHLTDFFTNQYNNDLRLTPEACIMLMMTLMERHVQPTIRYAPMVGSGAISIPAAGQLNPEETASLTKLVNEIKLNPAQDDRDLQPNFDSPKFNRTTVSVIKAFSKTFCNIPPFCGETDN